MVSPDLILSTRVCASASASSASSASAGQCRRCFTGAPCIVPVLSLSLVLILRASLLLTQGFVVEQIELLDQPDGDWVRVRTRGGVDGWIHWENVFYPNEGADAGADARAGACSPQRVVAGSPARVDESWGGGSLDKGQRALWQWRCGDKWVAYEPAHSASIEDQYQARHEYCMLGQWRIVFDSMRQYVAADPSRYRAVRRINRAPSPAQEPQKTRGGGGPAGDRGGGAAAGAAGVAGGIAHRTVQIWNHVPLRVSIQATKFSRWTATLNPVGAPKGAWYGSSFAQHEILRFLNRDSGATLGEWTVTDHKIQQLFCELDLHTRLPIVRAMVCHEGDAEYERYTFHPIRRAVVAIRETGRPVTIHEVAVQTGLREYHISTRQQAPDRKLQSKTGSPKRDRRSSTPVQRAPQQHEGGRERGRAGAGAGAGVSVVHEVQPPIDTIAIAILAHLDIADLNDSSRNWETISKIYHRGGCTNLRGVCTRLLIGYTQDHLLICAAFRQRFGYLSSLVCARWTGDLRSLSEAVDRYESTGGQGFWTQLLPFACRQALRFDELFPVCTCLKYSSTISCAVLCIRAG
eukprot:COSAG02_NODE_6336_length_3642_cov_3.835338_4_plen_577_part_00